MSVCAGCGERSDSAMTRDVDNKRYCSLCLDRRLRWRGDPLAVLFGGAIHRALVVLDDAICDAFGFSRRARGKYAQEF